MVNVHDNALTVEVSVSYQWAIDLQARISAKLQAGLQAVRQGITAGRTTTARAIAHTTTHCQKTSASVVGEKLPGAFSFQ
jgi:hypothetical protein